MKKFTVWVYTGNGRGRVASGWDCDTIQAAEKLRTDFQKSDFGKVTIKNNETGIEK